MNFVSAYEVANESRKSGGRAGIQRSKQPVVFATDRRQGSSGWIYSLRFGISPDVYSQARFLDGDRLDILFDKDSNMAKIVRVSEGGWLAVPSGKAASARRSLKFPWFKGLPSIDKTQECEVVSVDMNSITIRLPECVSYDRNLREEADNNPAFSLHLSQ